MILTPWQIAVRESYGLGDYAHIESVASGEACDLLFYPDKNTREAFNEGAGQAVLT